MWLSSCPSTLLKRLFFPHWMVLAPLSKICWPQTHVFLSRLWILFPYLSSAFYFLHDSAQIAPYWSAFEFFLLKIVPSILTLVSLFCFIFLLNIYYYLTYYMTHAMKYKQHKNRYVIAFIFLAKKPVLLSLYYCSFDCSSQSTFTSSGCILDAE